MSKKVQAIKSKLEIIKDDLVALEAEAQEYYDNRSEKWLESDAASEWEDKIEAFNDAADSIGDAIEYLADYV